jgi:GT2 family glycosyltransferase
VVCGSDEAVLNANLLSSPCLAAGTPHEVLLMSGFSSAAAGLNRGLELAGNDWVVCVHQDVYLPEGWPQRFRQQLQQTEAIWGRIGVLGVYGVAISEGNCRRAGHVVDRYQLLREPTPLPARVDTLDELLLVVRKDAGLHFDERLGFHFYGADICQQARERGWQAVAVDALCFHNSASGTDLPPDFFASGRVFARKYADRLPIATSCALVDARWSEPAEGISTGR